MVRPALTYRASIDVPARFPDSRAVGAVLGLTPYKYQSGAGAIALAHRIWVDGTDERHRTLCWWIV
jgi:hypothetical protein